MIDSCGTVHSTNQPSGIPVLTPLIRQGQLNHTLCFIEPQLSPNLNSFHKILQGGTDFASKTFR